VVEIMGGLAALQPCTILLLTHDNPILDIADRSTILLLTHDNPILDIADRIIHMEHAYLRQDKFTPAATGVFSVK
jgi:ABC-type lipoprotein export system ATPase subunit